MNRNLIELNENQGIVIDEEWNAALISRKQKDYSLKEILEKENNLESLNYDLDMANREYKNTKSNLNLSILFNIIILLCVIFMVPEGINESIKSTLIGCGAFVIFSKSLLSTCYGLTISNKKKLRKLNYKICELENEIPKLEKEINDIKEKVNYTILSDDSSKSNYQELVFDNMCTQNEMKKVSKVKVLKLTKNE